MVTSRVQVADPVGLMALSNVKAVGFTRRLGTGSMVGDSRCGGSGQVGGDDNSSVIAGEWTGWGERSTEGVGWSWSSDAPWQTETGISCRVFDDDDGDETDVEYGALLPVQQQECHDDRLPFPVNPTHAIYTIPRSDPIRLAKSQAFHPGCTAVLTKSSESAQFGRYIPVIFAAQTTETFVPT
ncbi:hypothetical protein GMORB2_2282 [Geosmithia morbida]|uniref:Uncharacterized protein n=1 Tax=Geosmithia morbida TaxID=1094350 RepID=A0A9P4YRB2_9HYPO|nr:uncharacterized protein GMORB2_2282 [Geosmithia morbida]KAF4121320.1 hypothetical protein GMORB2_2282 [Geosmithia morbida]